jgi:hypothetical protein
MLIEQYSKPNYEVINGLLGMKKYVILKLIIIHNNNTLYKFEKVIKAMLKSYKGQIEKHKINTNYRKPRSSFEIHRTKEILKTNQIGHYEKYCENIYIYNNILTIKHLFAISQELLCLKNHCYYKNNFNDLEEQPVHQIFPIPALGTIYT